MPQELRSHVTENGKVLNINCHTGEASEEVMKTLTINNLLSHTGLKFLNISSEFIIDSIWPKMTRFDAELLLSGLAYLTGEARES